MVRIGFLAAITCAACAAFAQESDYAPVCTHEGTNGMVTMLLCPENMTVEDYAEEGRAACGERKPCGAWIWTDMGLVPEEAPDSHDKLPKESIQGSKAIWMNELDQLITLTPAAED